MAELGAEGIAQEVADYLLANLATHLSTVDGRFGDTELHLQPIVEWRLDDPVGGVLPDKLPVGWVVPQEIAVEEWGQTYDRFQTQIVVWILERDQVASILRKRIYRTLQAVWETLKAGHFDSSISWQIIETPVMDYSEILTGSGGLLYEDARIRVTLTSMEEA